MNVGAHVSTAGKHADPLGKAPLPTAFSTSVARYIGEPFWDAAAV